MLLVTFAALGVAFYSAYGPARRQGAACSLATRRRARLAVWVAAVVVVVLVTFPYYVEYLI
jgi:hypothetical protein